MRPASLNRRQREDDLRDLKSGSTLDMIVIGGGITGAGVALDAASRGLSVALVERHDLAYGTSRWSSKLIHGGLRYLRNGDIGVAWESARERHIMMTSTAPHLTRPLPFLVPLTQDMTRFYGLLSASGIRVGDALRLASGSSRSLLPPPRRISALEARTLAPDMTPVGVRGAILFWDGQAVDDARIVIAVARTAQAHGASIITHCSVAGVDKGTVSCRDELGGEHFELHARCVVNAAGVWADTLTSTVTLRPSKGSHLVIDAAALGSPRAALMVPAPGERARWIGATPTSDGTVIVGVTDFAVPTPVPELADIDGDEKDYLLGIIGRALGSPLPASAIVGSYAGFRPLLGAEGEPTSDISRVHALRKDDAKSMLTIVGGKFTTYRAMAEDAVDKAQEWFGLGGGRCRTARLPLVGAAPRSTLVHLNAPERLVARFGAEAQRLVELAGGDPEALAPLCRIPSVLPVEIDWAIQHEGAMTLDDLLDRRLRLDIMPEARAAVEPVASAAMAGAPAA